MRLRELTDRLDAYFRPTAFDEQDGWSFCFGPGEWDALLALTPAAFATTCNGLMIAPGRPDPEIDRAYLVVFPQPDLVDQIVVAERERGSPGALVLTHHVTDFETRGGGLTPVPLSRFEALREANIALYVVHAPLDCHPETSTSGALVDGLGLRRVRTFAPYVSGHAGMIGEQAPEPFGGFAERVRVLCELQSFEPAQVRHAGRPVSRIAVIAGGGDDVDSLREVLAEDVDTYLTGTWWTPQRGDWADRNRAAVRALLPEITINLLGCSHNASEQVVLRDQLLPLITGWGVETRLIRQADHWR
jgi:putative NIF3 family GTP cyclohydrolase 1 type 2